MPAAPLLPLLISKTKNYFCSFGTCWSQYRRFHPAAGGAAGAAWQEAAASGARTAIRRPSAAVAGWARGSRSRSAPSAHQPAGRAAFDAPSPPPRRRI